ncbi:DUF1801 domain-containing protein [Microbacterium sp. W4I20]|uniref:DUF1801 domain-containing protein n=1 Tax=Microbacterium sp. W4I20 TaxID=3042262 RepID=UPI0027815173|nr:DUF1801 domain-containing protein [Microbacterium sp. W4I20]MDQ0727178.1 hypothetical protein [Microbacterium sp. W4I20]
MPTQFATVAEFLDAQPPERRAEVEWLQALVFEAEPGVGETIKWNSPNYTLNGVDRLTVNAAGRGPVRLILHFGTDRAEAKNAPPTFSGDPQRRLIWHSDIRASLPVPPAAERAEDRDALIGVIRAWLAES